MLSYLREDLYSNVVPLLEKIPEGEREPAEKLTVKVLDVINQSSNAFEVNAWYGRKADVRGEVEKFAGHSDPHIADFGAKLKWLLTKGAYFYSDD